MPTIIKLRDEEMLCFDAVGSFSGVSAVSALGSVGWVGFCSHGPENRRACNIAS